MTQVSFHQAHGSSVEELGVGAIPWPEGQECFKAIKSQNVFLVWNYEREWFFLSTLVPSCNEFRLKRKTINDAQSNQSQRVVRGCSL